MNILEEKAFCNCVELDPIMFDFEAGSGQKPCQSCVFKVAEGVRARQGNKGICVCSRLSMVNFFAEHFGG